MEVNYLYLIGAVVGFVILGVVILIMGRKIKNANARMKLIPNQVIDDFNEAEKRFAQSSNDVTPQEVLWEMSKPHSNIDNERRLNYGTNYQNKYPSRQANESTSAKQRTSAGEGDSQTGRRESEAGRADRTDTSGSFSPQPANVQPVDDRRDTEAQGRNKPARRKFKPI